MHVSNSYAQTNSRKLLKLGNEIYYSDPDSSFSLCCQAEKEARLDGDEEVIADAILCKARYHILITDYHQAGIELNGLIDYYRSRKDYVKWSKALSLKSILLDRLGEDERSTEALKEAYQISKNHGDRRGEIARLTNLTLDFIVHKQADSAYHYLLILESLSADIHNEDEYYLAQNLGLYYSLIEDHTKALYYYQKAHQVAERFNMIDSKATILTHLSEAYRNLGMISEAETAARESFKVTVDHQLIFEERDAVEELILVYERKGDFKQAYEMRGRLKEVDDQIDQMEQAKELRETEYKQNLAIKQNELTEKQLKLNEEQLKSSRVMSQNVILYAVIAVVLLILLFTVIIFRRTKKFSQEIELGKIILEQKNKEVLDSIHYAKQIQEAILPPLKYYEKLLDEVYVFYRPKDIVAGDFYWFDKVGDTVYFAVADCTGHGVPGAMVSVICHTALNRSLNEFKLEKPAEILEKTSELVIETFVKSDREVQDGMDIALCALNMTTLKLWYSGANNPAWIIKSIESENLSQVPASNMIASEHKVLIELKANKQPIGNFSRKQIFMNQSIQLEPGDVIYLSSDGYFDQFGGDKGKKIKSRLFKEKLLQIQNNSLQEQHELLVSLFDNWKGDLEQVDDVCVMGVRLGRTNQHA